MDEDDGAEIHSPGSKILTAASMSKSICDSENDSGDYPTRSKLDDADVEDHEHSMLLTDVED